MRCGAGAFGDLTDDPAAYLVNAGFTQEAVKRLMPLGRRCTSTALRAEAAVSAISEVSDPEDISFSTPLTQPQKLRKPQARVRDIRKPLTSPIRLTGAISPTDRRRSPRFCPDLPHRVPPHSTHAPGACLQRCARAMIGVTAAPGGQISSGNAGRVPQLGPLRYQRCVPPDPADWIDGCAVPTGEDR